MSRVAAAVRTHDRDRFQTVLFAPQSARESLFALYAFNYEIARVRETVREEMLGRIRLQWWREAVDSAFAGQPARRHDVVEALSAAIRRHRLTRAYFERLIEARESDLGGVAPATLDALEAYCEASSASLVHLAAEILGGAEERAAREVGIGYGIAGLLRAMPYHSAAGRRTVPDIGEAAAAAERHLAAARTYRVPRAALAAFLPAIVAGRYLVRLKRAGGDPFDPALLAPDPLQSWRLLAASLRGRF